MAELADGSAAAIAGAADRPFVLFGHGFGAVPAFEVARRVGGLPDFRHLVASGCSAPALLPTRRVVKTARLEGRAFTEAVDFFDGLPPEAVADEALQELPLPHLRSDFRLVAGYAYRPAPPLTVPVTLVNGTDDPHVKEAGLGLWAAGFGLWARECSGEPTRRWVEGGHLHFDGRPGAATDVLRAVIRSEDGAKSFGGKHVEVI
ncbi:alpha/beta fold hydrolase [Streptomyces prasinus]